jgi:hypothetical protein
MAARHGARPVSFLIERAFRADDWRPACAKCANFRIFSGPVRFARAHWRACLQHMCGTFSATARGLLNCFYFWAGYTPRCNASRPAFRKRPGVRPLLPAKRGGYALISTVGAFDSFRNQLVLLRAEAWRLRSGKCSWKVPASSARKPPRAESRVCGAGRHRRAGARLLKVQALKPVKLMHSRMDEILRQLCWTLPRARPRLACRRVCGGNLSSRAVLEIELWGRLVSLISQAPSDSSNLYWLLNTTSSNFY